VLLAHAGFVKAGASEGENLMLERKTLLERLNSWVLKGLPGKGQCRVVALFHREGARDMPVMSWDINPDTDIQALATEIVKTADGDAGGIGGEQAYALCAFFGEQGVGASSYGARLPFVIYAPPTFDNDGEVGVGSSGRITNPKEFAAMAGQFALDVMKTNIPWNNSMMSMQQKIIDRQEGQITELLEERRKNVILTEKLQSMHFKRQMQLRKVLNWEKHKDAFADMLMPMIPVVLSGLAGRPMLPQAQTEETITFEQFVESIKPEQLMQLQTVLKPYQLPAIMAIVQAVKMKQGIDPTMLREFIKSIDEPQMEAFKKVLTAEQADMLLAAIGGFVQKYEAEQAERKKAYEEMQREMAEEEQIDEVADDEALR